MITAATNPDVGPMTVGWALGAVTTGMLLAGLLIYALWATRDGRFGPVEAWLDRRLDRRRERARQENAQPTLAYHRGHRPIRSHEVSR